MAIVVPDEGEVILMGWAIRDSSVTEDTKLILYQNNLGAPDQDTVYGDLTECDFTGYSQVVLARSDWNAPSTVSHKAKIVLNSAITFTFTDTVSQTAYGYAVVNDAEDTILWIEEFSDGPRVFTVSGDSLTFTPQLTGNSEN